MKRGIMFAVLLGGATLVLAGPLRDPTRPPQPAAAHARAAGPAVPAVSAVIVRKAADGSLQLKAIVDGRWVRAGEEVSGGRVQAISAEGVRWVRGGKVHELHVMNSGSTIKKPAAQPQGAKGVA